MASTSVDDEVLPVEMLKNLAKKDRQMGVAGTTYTVDVRLNLLETYNVGDKFCTNKDHLLKKNSHRYGKNST